MSTVRSYGQIGRARKAGPCENSARAERGLAPWCRVEIQPGEEFAYGDLQPDKAGGFGRSRKCAACVDHDNIAGAQS